MIVEINFDGLIGPTHNYAALSFGNLASASNAGAVSRPRDAALQGLAKMRFAMSLGLTQGFLLPLDRPDAGWLRQLGFAGSDAQVCAAAHRADPRLFAQACSASAMWTANAGTVSPAADTADGRTHITTANLSRMTHRSLEAAATEAQLRRAFAHPAFAVHAAVPATFGDEGAANHMRLAPAHAVTGVEIFVYGEEGGTFPARQNRRASEAVARRHGLAPERTIFAAQSPAAIDAGAFHNDVVAVANEHVLFAHEQAFADPDRLHADIRARLPGATIITVPASAVSLAEAIRSYLFNSQLVTVPDGSMALILPQEAHDCTPVKAWLDRLVTGDTPIRAVHYVHVRESMRNGGGPACLRLRVVADPATVDPRFLLDDARADRLEAVITAHWPEAIGPDDLGNPDLWAQAWAARAALIELQN
ncbi:N-succinylarginine dihydrolase [Polymorphobacter fuscus]|uniref:N-succinylarginine dihydrolase n=1 Tax=Sandarakinorhabdus fusca TaxID=1439888 RepID=A0A7C9KY80_9SPHN|nr:N-succinylarginine dihydrolase [Polymorphobacter fuscus]KAB7647387.1 N-succinylarginine dihydrolase [Polymorphobacter fuscus]MQT16628.1 N-succinylarginine dihydrolase [Polymorphobacter fuscus]NJC09389.1 succinylarginine dihydrolase [Polymorphobacter fuscus]